MTSPREFATDVVRRLTEHGHTALFAGGCVRDLVLGREPKDYDVATNAVPETVREIFGRRRTLAVGASFGVIIVLGPTKSAGQVEVATFRSEGPYLDGRRPENVVFTTAEADAQRRDFTINGMFYDPLRDEIRDFVGGKADLERRVLRAIGDPRQRMEEDKLRMLRAVRFAANLDFSLDSKTAAAVRELASELIVVSAERIAQELRRMLVDPHRRRAMELCDELQLLRVMVPELQLLTTSPNWQTTLKMLDALVDPTFEVATAVLLQAMNPASELPEILHRLRLSNAERDRITWLVSQQAALDEAPRLRLCELKRLLSHAGSRELLAFLAARLAATGADRMACDFCEHYLQTTPAMRLNPPPLITGGDLIGQGLSPGPRFRELLESIRDLQLNEVLVDREAAMETVRELMAKP